jgi:hypothetical protein
MNSVRITDSGEIVKKKGGFPAAEYKKFGYRFVFQDKKNALK